jgi:high-affinity iron transporter
VFAVTGSLLLYLAFVFIGKGVYNLQEAGLFAPHPLPWIPDHEALRQVLGLYPLAETILAQAVFLLLLSAGAIWLRARRPRPADVRVGSADARVGPADSPVGPAARPRPEAVESR